MSYNQASSTGPSRWARVVSFLRTHPTRRAGANWTIWALVVLLVIGLAGGNTGTKDSGKQSASESSPTPSASSPTAMTSVSASPTVITSAPASPSSARITAAPVDAKQAGPRTAASLLATLLVKGRAPKTGYERDMFGSAWTDDNTSPLGHNGCDTRNDILGRDLATVALKPGTNGCVVLSGTLNDPYTATRISFVRGQSTSGDVQIDHVVALSDAWQKGAQQWPTVRRIAFANDPLNLLAVDGPTNAAKGDGDAATWLPPNRGYRCAYVARQVAVKVRYGLWVTGAERDAIAGVLGACPGQVAPAEGGTPPPVTPTATHPKTTAAAPPAPPAAPVPADVYYANCAAVRAAGKAPLHRGEPGYSSHLDRDGDGIACE